MQLIKPLLGVFAVLGTWPNWERYFDLSRKGLKSSFFVLTLSLVPIWMIIYGVQSERARTLDEALILPDQAVDDYAQLDRLWVRAFGGLCLWFNSAGAVALYAVQRRFICDLSGIARGRYSARAKGSWI